jgi:hypothetical protein
MHSRVTFPAYSMHDDAVGRKYRRLHYYKLLLCLWQRRYERAKGSVVYVTFATCCYGMVYSPPGSSTNIIHALVVLGDITSPMVVDVLDDLLVIA